MIKHLFTSIKRVNNRIGSSLLGLTMFATTSAMFPATSYAELVKARRTDSFIDSIGIVVQVWNKDSAYIQYDDVVKPRLKELGIRHIRSITYPGDKKTISKLQELASMGIKLNLIMDPRIHSLTETIKLVEFFGKSIETIEGPNEWNHNLKKTYEGKSFPVGLKNYQSDLYKKVKQDPDTAHIDIIGPSLSNFKGIQTAVETLGKVDCDINNAHNYPAGRKPLNSYFLHQLPFYYQMCGSDKPLISTETGYNNALKWKTGVSEEAAAKYLPRLLALHFDRGFKRTYIYELMNNHANPASDNKEYNFGLLRADGAKKPAFRAVRNLIGILDNSDVDPNVTKVPLGALDYEIEGNTSDLQQILLQKKDGRFYLLLWRNVDSYNLKSKSDLKVGYRMFNISFNNAEISQAKVYRPTRKNVPVKVMKNPQRLRLGISDDLMLIELTPKMR